MAYALTWLEDSLLRAGLKVAPVAGWQTRGRADMGPVYGVLCHHTAGRRAGNMPSLHTLIHGREDLRGPLAQLGLGRDGTYYVIAAGRANHAGPGRWQGHAHGNTHFIGIEAENTGQPEDVWPAVQLDAYRRGVAALLSHLRLTAQDCAGHGEYALPQGRKSDPSFDMASFRSAVAELLASAAPPELIPRVEPNPPASSGAARATLRRGDAGPLVSVVQRQIGITTDGTFGPRTEAAVRALQRMWSLTPDGIVGPKTWRGLDEHRDDSVQIARARAI